MRTPAEIAAHDRKLRLHRWLFSLFYVVSAVLLGYFLYTREPARPPTFTELRESVPGAMVVTMVKFLARFIDLHVRVADIFATFVWEAVGLRQSLSRRNETACYATIESPGFIVLMPPLIDTFTDLVQWLVNEPDFSCMSTLRAMASESLKLHRQCGGFRKSLVPNLHGDERLFLVLMLFIYWFALVLTLAFWLRPR